MARPGRLWMVWQVCLCASFVLFGPLKHQAQQPAASTQAGTNTSDSSADPGQKLSGLAVIVKVASISGEPLFHADGYRIRVQPGAVTAFLGSLKSLRDVVPGTWIHFEGTRDDTGVLIASKAEFFPPGFRKALAAMGPRKVKSVPDYQPVTRDGLLDAEGHFVNVHTKVRYSEAGGPCGWHKVPANAMLQERVERIGMRLVPEFQKELAPDIPSRIPFRFYAVADDKVRSVFACNLGLVLVPQNVVERLQNDDQLAAVLADGVAFNLQGQLATLSPLDFAAAGSDVVAAIPALFPAGYIAGDVVAGLVGHEMEVRLERKIARIALQLVADADYDPWQAPEAWRLLDSKDPSPNYQSTKYTREGRYQLSILKLQYKRANSGSSAVSPAFAVDATRQLE